MFNVNPLVYLLLIFLAFILGFWEMGIMLILLGIVQLIGQKKFNLDGRESIFVFSIIVVIILILLDVTGIWDIEWTKN